MQNVYKETCFRLRAITKDCASEDLSEVEKTKFNHDFLVPRFNIIQMFINDLESCASTQAKFFLFMCPL